MGGQHTVDELYGVLCRASAMESVHRAFLLALFRYSPHKLEIVKEFVKAIKGEMDTLLFSEDFTDHELQLQREAITLFLRHVQHEIAHAPTRAPPARRQKKRKPTKGRTAP